MKLKNSSGLPSHFLRRLASWCCKLHGLPVKRIKTATFTRCSGSWRGRAWQWEILVRVGNDACFPAPPHRYGGYDAPAIADRLEAFVWITAHELYHLLQWHERLKERRVRYYDKKITVPE